MIMDIYKPNDLFNFKNFSLDDPGRLQGGAYYSKIKYNEKSFFIETPKCSTKKGIVVTGKKTYCDLIYTTNEYEMINWIIEFEQTIKNLLFTKSELWFHNELDLDDIEYFFNSSIRTYKENLQVMRTYILSSKHLNNTSLQIYDENESIKHLKDVLNKSIKAIICFKGVKFTSTSFQLDIDIKQILIIEQKQIFNKCMISNIHNTLEIVDNNKEYAPNTIKDTTETEDNVDADTVENVDADAVENVDADAVENVDADAVENVDADTVENVDADAVENVDADTVENVDADTVENVDADTVENLDADTVENLDADAVENVDADTVENVDADVVKNVDADAVENINTTFSDMDISENIYENVKELTINNDNTKITESNNHNTTNVKNINKDNKNITSSLGNTTSTLNNNTSSTNKKIPITQTLEEYDIKINNTNSITLKRPNEVFYDIYKESRRKAKLAKRAAIAAYLEAKHIKQTYLLDEINDNSDEDELTDLDNLSEISEDEITHNL